MRVLPVLTIVLVGWLLITQVSAENRFFFPPGMEGYQGEDATLCLMLETDTMLSGYGFSCVIDTTAFEFTLPDSEAFTWDTTAADIGNLTVKFVSYDDSLGSFGGFAVNVVGCDPGVAIGEWIALNINIHIREDAVPGVHDFQVPYPSNPCGGTDCDGADVDFNEYDGHFEVLAHITLTAPEADTLDEGDTSTFDVVAVDALGHNVDLSLSYTDLPLGSYVWADVGGSDSVSGSFQTNPGYCDSGEYTAVFHAECGEGISTEATVSVVINNMNRSPHDIVTQPECPSGVLVDSLGLIWIDGMDYDWDECMDDSLQIGFSGIVPDSFFDYDDGTAHLFWTPDTSDTGAYAVTFTVTDSYDSSYSEVCSLFVVLEHVIELSIPEADTVNEGGTSSFQAVASDNLAWPIMLALMNTDLPAGSYSWEDQIGAGAVSGVFGLHPNYCDSGSYEAVFRAYHYVPAQERYAYSEDTISISVLNSNRAPNVQSISAKQVMPLDTLTFTVTSGDLDYWECGDDSLTLSFSFGPTPPESIPVFVQNSDTTGVFAWIPGAGDAGNYTAAFVTQDLEGVADTELVAISVSHEPFMRADANSDMSFYMIDVIYVLRWLYIPGAPDISCLDAADANDDGGIEMSDAVYMLNCLYVGGPAPPFPYPDCGSDPTEDDLGCESHPCQETRLIENLVREGESMKRKLSKDNE